MKTKLLLLSSFFSCFCFGQVSNSNLVAHYNFDNSGTNQVNSTMYNLAPATSFEDFPTYSNDGILGGCVNFSGTNALVNDVQLANYFSAQTDKSLTISFWMKSNDIVDGLKTFVEGFESVVVRGIIPSFLISRTNGIYQAGIAINDNGDSFFVDNNEWNHLVYIYNPSMNSLLGYINNVLWVNLSLTGSEQAFFQYTNRFVVGAGTNDNSINWAQKAYTGKIDEMYIFSRAITASEVQALYNLQTPQSECPDGDVTFISQDDVNAFVAQYPNCTQINGNLALTYTIPGPPIPSNFGDLGSLTSITGDLTLNIPTFININPSGLQNITSVGGKLTVAPFGNITNLDFLSGLTSVGSLDLGNESITQIQGLSDITGALNGGITINGCSSLTSLVGLQNITSLGGQLNITSNAQLTSLEGLEGLTSVNNNISGGIYSIWLFNNANLTSLNGLQNITTLTASDLPNTTSGFYLLNNTNLTNINALSNVTNILDRINITNNTQLATCAITTVCNKLAVSTSGVNISGNNQDCQSVEDVQAACALSSDDFNLSELSIYPNPFNNKISISLGNEYQNVKTTMVDMTGKQLFVDVFSGNLYEINQLEGLTSGMYLLTIELENGKRFTQKIIK
jgi:hypothetical protein